MTTPFEIEVGSVYIDQSGNCPLCKEKRVVVSSVHYNMLSFQCFECREEFRYHRDVFLKLFTPIDTEVKAIECDSSQSKCVCDMRELMIGGCKCGGC